MMIEKMLNTAVNYGLTLVVGSDGDVDYEGQDVNEAMSALEACDEIELTIYNGDSCIGWALVINEFGADDDDRIADCSGWIDGYLG